MCQGLTAIRISNSPHPCSVSSKGVAVISLTGVAKLSCKVNTTWTMLENL